MEYLTPVSSVITVVIWIIYLQLFFREYHRNSRPYLVFHHAHNDNPDAICMLVNMGEKAVHVQCVQAVVCLRDGQQRSMTITDFNRINPDNELIQQKIRQGPVGPGGYLLLGTFREILLGSGTDETHTNWSIDDVDQLELRVAVIHGPSKFPVGARRSFTVSQQPHLRLYPTNIHTEQLVRRRDWPVVRGWVESELNPQRRGSDESDNSSQQRANGGETRD